MNSQEAAKEIIDTLKPSDCECTESPYWLLIDPRQNFSCDPHAIASMITGPFFSRKDAEEYLKRRRYKYSKRAVVYCHSGYWSDKYKDLCRAIKNEGGLPCA